MAPRFDHLVIAVSDLDRAVASYRSLGFGVSPGGRHERHGTHNALIRLDGPDYVELLGVEDPEKAAKSAFSGHTLVEFVRYRDGGLVGHCYATDDIERVAARAREAGVEMVGPFGMRRARPDGSTLSWRLTVPVDVPWRRRWPFFIQWGDPDEERLAVEAAAGSHENGATSVAGLSVAVRDLRETTDLYSVLFESGPHRTDEVPNLAASRASFDVHGFGVDLLSPTRDGPIRKALHRDGEGPFEARIEVEDLAAARALLPGAEEDEGGLRVPDDRAFGARLVLVERGRQTWKAPAGRTR